MIDAWFYYLPPILSLTGWFWEIIDIWRALVASAVGMLGLMISRLESEVEDLLTGEGRRLNFPPVRDFHPRPSPDCAIANSLKYTSGFVGGDSTKIWYQCFKPEKPIAILVAMHGYADHSDYRMYELTHELAVRGDLMVISFDQLGFGRSDGLWGYIPDWFQHVHSSANAIKDILKVLQDNGTSKLPVFAYGHSMGGGLAISLSVMYPGMFKGLVLSAPMCGINPGLRKSWIVEKIFFLLADWFPKLPITPVPDLSRLCYKDEEFWRQERKKNRLAFPLKPRLGTARSMLNAQSWISEHAKDVNIPFLIVHGESDLVTSPAGSIEFHLKASSADKRVEIVKGGYHIMMGYGMESLASEFSFNTLVDWVNKRTL
jgi:acylglycerol lipase